MNRAFVGSVSTNHLIGTTAGSQLTPQQEAAHQPDRPWGMGRFGALSRAGQPPPLCRRAHAARGAPTSRHGRHMARPSPSCGASLTLRRVSQLPCGAAAVLPRAAAPLAPPAAPPRPIIASLDLFTARLAC